MFFYLLFTIVLVLLDQWTKYLTIKNIPLFEVKEVFPNFLSFTHIRNTGAAWSILEGQMWLFYIITVLVIGVLLYYLYMEGRQDKIFGFILSIILAGTIGNFIDRLIYKEVIDMIRVEFINFPIFNVADMLLTVGVLLLVIYTFIQEKST